MSDSVSALHAAVRAQDIAAIKRLVAEDPAILAQRCASGWTALIVASYHGATRSIGQLLAAGADPNLANPKGTTPLMYAKGHYLRTGDAAPIALLLDAGADPDARDMQGLTLLEYVPEGRRAEVARLLGR